MKFFDHCTNSLSCNCCDLSGHDMVAPFTNDSRALQFTKWTTINVLLAPYFALSCERLSHTGILIWNDLWEKTSLSGILKSTKTCFPTSCTSAQADMHADRRTIVDLRTYIICCGYSDRLFQLFLVYSCLGI